MLIEKKNKIKNANTWKWRNNATTNKLTQLFLSTLVFVLNKKSFLLKKKSTKLQVLVKLPKVLRKNSSSVGN